jgi:hypothetical protein
LVENFDGTIELLSFNPFGRAPGTKLEEIQLAQTAL